MKKRLLSILLVAAMVVAMLPAMVFATGAEDAVPSIDWNAQEITLMTADDFKAFHDQIHAKGKGAFADQVVKLGADIDMTGYTLTPFTAADADGYVGFAGTLDGQYHTLSGITMALSANCTGFLGNPGYVNGAEYKPHIEIKNLALINSTIGSSSRSDIGGFYGMANAIVRFTNVYNAATIDGKGSTGAFVHSTRWGSGQVIFNNCVFAGVKLNSSTSNTGFVGKLNHTNTNTSTFTNCVMAGSLRDSSSNVLQKAYTFVGSVNGKSVTYTNCVQYSDYFQTGDGVASAVSQNCVGIGSGFTAMAPEGFITTTSYPIPATLAPFFRWDVAEITLMNADDYLTFHSKLIEGKKFLGQTVKLGADIDLGGATLGALGAVDTSNNTTFSNGKGFYGIFDGQFHTLSNLKLASNVTNAGLFGSLSSKARGDATAESFEANVQIKNLKVENLSATGLKRYGLFYGDVNVPVSFENVYMNATTTSGKHMGGGFVGNALKYAVMSFTNCVFDGDLNYTWYMGSGFVGALGDNHTAPTTKPVFTNCVVSGTFQNDTGTVGGGAHYIGNKRDDANAGVFTNCIQYTDYRQTGDGAASALCPTLTNIGSGLTAKTPEGFTARNTSYPVPTTLLPFFADSVNAAHTEQAGGENALTVEYYGAQKKAVSEDDEDEWNVRLIGAMNVADEAALANYKAVGFEIVAVSQNTGEIMNVGATNIYDVYTSYLENDAPITAAEAGGTYVFMLALEDIPMDKGIATFAIKTYYTDANGATVYTDMYVLNFNTAAPAAA